jgi:hypothetical protein
MDTGNWLPRAIEHAQVRLNMISRNAGGEWFWERHKIIIFHGRELGGRGSDILSTNR